MVAYLRQIGYLDGSTILFYDVAERNVVEEQITVLQVEPLLRKVVGLVNKLEVTTSGFHLVAMFKREIR